MKVVVKVIEHSLVGPDTEFEVVLGAKYCFETNLTGLPKVTGRLIGVKQAATSELIYVVAPSRESGLFGEVGLFSNDIDDIRDA